MKTMDVHLDGNAYGGLLMETFGREMTDADGCCAGCGLVGALGRMRVYPGASAVFRCPGCNGVVLVAVTVQERTRIHTPGLRWLEPRGG
jgi:hypothetical protein